MSMGQRIEEAIAFVKNIFEFDYSGHDFYHTLRVYHTATTIAKEEGAELEIVQLAALLHDVDDIKLSKATHTEKKNAVTFLKSQNIDEAMITRICDIIECVSFAGSGSQVPDTLEGKVVQDADRLDAIGAIGIARTFAYGGNRKRPMHIPDIAPKTNMTKEEYQNYQSTSINHFYEKLLLLKDMLNTSEGKRIADHRHAYMQEFLTEFFEEWDGVK